MYSVKPRIFHFCSCDLDLDSMTLKDKFDLDILKMYLRNKIQFLGKGFHKLEHKQDRQTHRRDQTHYYSSIGGW